MFPTILLIPIGTDAVLVRIVLIALQHALEHLVVLRDEKLLTLHRTLDDLTSQGCGLGRIGLSAIERRALERTGGNLHDAVLGTLYLELHVGSLDEHAYGSLRSTVIGKERGREMGGNAHHHSAIERLRLEHPGIEMTEDADRAFGIDSKDGTDILVIEVLDHAQMTIARREA